MPVDLCNANASIMQGENGAKAADGSDGIPGMNGIRGPKGKRVCSLSASFICT